MKSMHSFLLCAGLFASAIAHADDIKVAMFFPGGGDRMFISIFPKGGLGASRGGKVTDRQTFTMQNLTGEGIQSGAQVKFRYSGSIWRRSGAIINRVPAGKEGDSFTIFELKDVGDQYRLMAPGGGWLGGLSKEKRSFQVVENEEDALLVEFIVNPMGDNS